MFQKLLMSVDGSLLVTRDGNASYCRKHEPFIYVTPSGVRKYQQK